MAGRCRRLTGNEAALKCGCSPPPPGKSNNDNNNNNNNNNNNKHNHLVMKVDLACSLFPPLRMLLQ